MKNILEDPEFIKLKKHEYYTLNCYECNNDFQKDKKNLKARLLQGKEQFFCSRECFKKFYSYNTYNHVGLITTVQCQHCNETLNKTKQEVQNHINHNIKYFFCNHSCSAAYHNTHKKFGMRRSKLEKWLEDKLTILYPKLDIIYCNKEAINSELDIFIPSLNLAFELNGLFHYEPIFGKDTLDRIQNNDGRKFQACLERGIELCIIDTSGQKYVKDSTSQKYLDIIETIINKKLPA